MSAYENNPELPAPPTRTPVTVEPTRIDRDTRTLEVTLTTASRDRQGDVVEPTGLDFSNYLKNPVVLWAHDLSLPPVGKVLNVTVGPREVSARVLFASTEFAREVFDLYADGFLNAWSVGFIPKKWNRLPSGGNAPGGCHVLEAEVVEVSAVPVPANPEALTRMLSHIKSIRLRDSLEQRAPKPITLAQLGVLGRKMVEALTPRLTRRCLDLARGVAAPHAYSQALANA
jgi:HK97 family phage prohead protease